MELTISSTIRCIILCNILTKPCTNDSSMSAPGQSKRQRVGDSIFASVVPSTTSKSLSSVETQDGMIWDTFSHISYVDSHCSYRCSFELRNKLFQNLKHKRAENHLLELPYKPICSRITSSSWSCQCPWGCGTVVKIYIIIITKEQRRVLPGGKNVATQVQVDRLFDRSFMQDADNKIAMWLFNSGFDYNALPSL